MNIGKHVYIRLRPNGRYVTLIGKVSHVTSEIVTMPQLGNVQFLTVQEYDSDREFMVMYTPANPFHMFHTSGVSHWLKCYCHILEDVTIQDFGNMGDIESEFQLSLCFMPRLPRLP